MASLNISCTFYYVPRPISDSKERYKPIIWLVRGLLESYNEFEYESDPLILPFHSYSRLVVQL